MANAYNQLASLLRSGVPMMRSLTVMSNQATKPALKAVLEDVKARVEEGEPLSEAMARYPRVFNDMAVNMVRAGTEGGFLEDALERVAFVHRTARRHEGASHRCAGLPSILGLRRYDGGGRVDRCVCTQV
jgi:type II secretory pathway component PulF